VADPEVDWFTRNPEPHSSQSGDVLTLWNFPVTGTKVAPAHEEAIRRFAGEGFIASSPDHEPMEFAVVGHASASGAEGSNIRFSQKRADNVKAVLTQMGFRSVTAEGVGSSMPADPGKSGLALAHNRRVEVTRHFIPEPPKPVEERPPEEPRKPPSRPPRGPAEFATKVTVKIDLPVRRWETTRVIIAASIVGDLDLWVRGTASDPFQAGVTTMDGSTPRLTPEFAQILGRDVVGPKLGLDAGYAEGLPNITVGIEAEHWYLLPKVRYQEGPYLVSFNYKAVVARLPIVNYQAVQVHMEFSGNLRFQIGPTATAVASFPTTADPGPTITGAPLDFKEAGPLVIAATIDEGAATSSTPGQAEMTKVVLNLATRDGAASRVAAVALGKEGDVGFAERRKEWGDRVSPQAQAAWRQGSNQVDELLHALDKDARDEKKAAWKKKYGGGPQPDFEMTRELIFRDLKGYDEDQGDLKERLEGL
jgi:hypothetical protein